MALWRSYPRVFALQADRRPGPAEVAAGGHRGLRPGGPGHGAVGRPRGAGVDRGGPAAGGGRGRSPTGPGDLGQAGQQGAARRPRRTRPDASGRCCWRSSRRTPSPARGFWRKRSDRSRRRNPPRSPTWLKTGMPPKFRLNSGGIPVTHVYATAPTRLRPALLPIRSRAALPCCPACSQSAGPQQGGGRGNNRWCL